MSAKTSVRQAPRKWRFAIFVFLGVYPLVTGLTALMPVAMPGAPLMLRTLVMVPIIVICMVWGIIPFIQTRLRDWL